MFVAGVKENSMHSPSLCVHARTHHYRHRGRSELFFMTAFPPRKIRILKNVKRIRVLTLAPQRFLLQHRHTLLNFLLLSCLCNNVLFVILLNPPRSQRDALGRFNREQSMSVEDK